MGEKQEESNNKVGMCGCAGAEMQEVPEFSQTFNRSHVHPVERSPVERLLAADLCAPPTSNFLHKKLSQLQQVEEGKKWWRSSFSAFASNNPQGSKNFHFLFSLAVVCVSRPTWQGRSG